MTEWNILSLLLLSMLASDKKNRLQKTSPYMDYISHGSVGVGNLRYTPRPRSFL